MSSTSKFICQRNLKHSRHLTIMIHLWSRLRMRSSLVKSFLGSWEMPLTKFYGSCQKVWGFKWIRVGSRRNWCSIWPVLKWLRRRWKKLSAGFWRRIWNYRRAFRNRPLTTIFWWKKFLRKMKSYNLAENTPVKMKCKKSFYWGKIRKKYFQDKNNQERSIGAETVPKAQLPKYYLPN